MRHWPSRLPYRLAVLHRRLSAEAIGFAQRHPRIPGAVFAQLRGLATRRPSFDSAELPAELRVTPVAIVYGDLFFVDEYPALLHGLRRINREFGPSFGVLEPGDWVRHAQTRAHGTGTTQAGTIDLTSRSPRCLERINLMLAHIAPSAIALVAYATPTPTFAEEFARLLHIPGTPDIRLRWPRRRFLGYTRFPEDKLRAEEVRQRLLAANKEVTLLFRSYFHAGLSLRGPLPSIEAFTVSQSREWLSRVMTLEAPDTRWDLLSVLGSTPGHALYETDTNVLYATSVQHGRYAFTNLQLLTTEPTKEKGSTAPDQHIEIFDDAWHVAPLLAFGHAYSHAINDVLQARDRLSTAIRPFHIRRIAWHISHSLRLGVLQFRLRLLRAELGKMPDRSLLHSFTEHIRRKEHWGRPPASLGDDLWIALHDKQDLLERQLDVVRTTHQEVTALKSLRVGYRLQWIAILLTAAAVFGMEIHDAIKAVWLRILSLVGL